MIGPLFHPEDIAVVMTAFGPYQLHPSETCAYMRVYAGEIGRSGEPKWQEELIDYATQQMESRWLAG